MPLFPGHAHAANGQIELTTDFPFDEIDERERSNQAQGFHVEQSGGDRDEFSAEEMDAAFKMFTRLLEWVWQGGMKNSDGLKIRTAIACWVFLKHLHPLTLTQLARGFGKQKQSYGRWVDHFKIEFPHIRNPHMKE